MKTNFVKKKLKAGQPSYGTWLSLGDLYAARVMARLGWDWLTLDMEHQPIDWSQAAAIFGAIADAGCVPLARVPEGNHFFIKRALDAGALGNCCADGQYRGTSPADYCGGKISTGWQPQFRRRIARAELRVYDERILSKGQ